VRRGCLQSSRSSACEMRCTNLSSARSSPIHRFSTLRRARSHETCAPVQVRARTRWAPLCNSRHSEGPMTLPTSEETDSSAKPRRRSQNAVHYPHSASCSRYPQPHRAEDPGAEEIPSLYGRTADCPSSPTPCTIERSSPPPAAASACTASASTSPPSWPVRSWASFDLRDFEQCCTKRRFAVDRTAGAARGRAHLGLRCRAAQI